MSLTHRDHLVVGYEFSEAKRVCEAHGLTVRSKVLGDDASMEGPLRVIRQVLVNDESVLLTCARENWQAAP